MAIGLARSRASLSCRLGMQMMRAPVSQEETRRAFRGDIRVEVIASYAALDSINDGPIDRLRGSFHGDSSCLEHD
ncbi:unnamed protein product [Gadus morhua 'NCC']